MKFSAGRCYDSKVFRIGIYICINPSADKYFVIYSD